MAFSPRFSRADVDLEDRKVVYQGYFRVDRYRLRHRRFDGTWSETIHREVFERGHAVAVLLYDPDLDRLVLIEQFRPGAYAAHAESPIALPSESPWLLEIVAGIVEPGEDAAEVARREAIEEAGCEIEDLFPACSMFASPGGASETLELYCGRVHAANASGVYGLAYEQEDIRVLTLAPDEAFRLLDEGRVVNATAMIALYWLRTNLNKVRSRWTA